MWKCSAEQWLSSGIILMEISQEMAEIFTFTDYG